MPAISYLITSTVLNLFDLTLFAINLNNPAGTLSVHIFLRCFELVFVVPASFVDSDVFIHAQPINI